MATPVPPRLPNGIAFSRSARIPGGSAAFDVNAQPGSDVLAALLANQPFPSRRIDLGEIAVRPQTGEPITFDTPRGTVSFSGKGGVYAGIAVLDDPADVAPLLVRDRVNDRLVEDLALERLAGHRFVVLRWGYDLEAAAKGSVALGVGAAVTFGAEAARLGAYAVIRQVDASLGSQAALRETFDGWMLPSQFQKLDDLRPGTWIVTEVDGSLALRLGTRYGYDFNWVREAARLGGLSGDIGLKIQLGVSTTFGFETSGQYAVVLGRPAQGRRLCLQLFRLDRKGLSFACSATGSAQASPDDLLPERFDEFIEGVFGLHGLQVLEDLDAWTDPDRELSDLIAGVSDEYARKLLKSVTGVDPEQAYEMARTQLVDLLKAWHRLPHQVASTTYAIVQRDRTAMPVLKPLLARLASEDATTFRPELERLLGRVDFFTTPFGQWLESAAAGPVLGAVSRRPEYARVQEVARQTLAVLDGSVLEETLVSLQREIGNRLGLTQIESAVDAASFDRVDDWLKARLSDFIGQRVDLPQLRGIRETTHRLIGLRHTMFAQAREALRRKYELQAIASYQRSTTKTALVDVAFDFGTAGASSAELTALARETIDGNFNRVLLNPVQGVTLNHGVLTHELTRQTHLEVTLPFAHAEIDHLNRSLAQVQSIDAERGRILVYDLSSDDLVTARKKFSSRFAVHGRFTKGTRVRVFDEASLSHAYTFRQAAPRMRRKALEAQMRTYVETYLPDAFGDGDASLGVWIADLDRTVDRLLSNGPDTFGNTLLSLEVSAPARLVSAWTKAPASEKAAEYLRMSLAIQRQLKRLIPICHFQNVDQYRTRMPSAVLLVYAALEPATGIRVSGRRVTQFLAKGDVYWDFDTAGRLDAMAAHGLTLARLHTSLQAVHDILMQADGMAAVAREYHPDRLQTIIGDALGPGEQHLRNLLIVERSVIRRAHKAGVAIAQALSAQNPSDAQHHLARFGAEVTDAFNSEIDSLFSGPALRPLGTMVFLEAARAFDPALEAERPSAMLELAVLKEPPSFDLASFVEGSRPPAEDIVRAEKLVALSPA